MADNDYALGLLVEKVAHSPYRNDTLIFVLEDDAQDGPDHVDAHRSIAFVIGPYVRQHAVVSAHYTTVHVLRTIEGILGIEPLGLDDSSVAPMDQVFERKLRPWSYTAIVPAVLRTTRLPLPPGPAPAGRAAAYATPRHNATWWAAQTRGMDFSVEDHLDTPRFNRILWHGLMGKTTSYPKKRDGRDLRRDRKRLLAAYARTRDARKPPGTATASKSK